jgi:hypothetical protein
MSTNQMIIAALVAAVLYKVYDENTAMQGQVNSMERYLVMQARQNQQQQHGVAPPGTNHKHRPPPPPKRRDPGVSSGDDEDIPQRNNFDSDDDTPKLVPVKGSKHTMGANRGSSEAISDSMMSSDPLMSRR